MQVRLSPEDEQRIQQKLEGGRSTDSAEVIHEALLALEQRDQLERLNTAFAIGEDDLLRGAYADWTPELRRHLHEEADELARLGVIPDAVVCAWANVCHH